MDFCWAAMHVLPGSLDQLRGTRRVHPVVRAAFIGSPRRVPSLLAMLLCVVRFSISPVGFSCGAWRFFRSRAARFSFEHGTFPIARGVFFPLCASFFYCAWRFFPLRAPVSTTRIRPSLYCFASLVLFFCFFLTHCLSKPRLKL